MQDVTVRLTRNGGEAEVGILLSRDAFDELRRVARLRGKPVEEVIVEGLRLTKLLASQELLVREYGRVKELVAV